MRKKGSRRAQEWSAGAGAGLGRASMGRLFLFVASGVIQDFHHKPACQRRPRSPLPLLGGGAVAEREGRPQ